MPIIVGMNGTGYKGEGGKREMLGWDVSPSSAKIDSGDREKDGEATYAAPFAESISSMSFTGSPHTLIPKSFTSTASTSGVKKAGRDGPT